MKLTNKQALLGSLRKSLISGLFVLQDFLPSEEQSSEKSRGEHEWGWGCSGGESSSEGGVDLSVLWGGTAPLSVVLSYWTIKSFETLIKNGKIKLFQKPVVVVSNLRKQYKGKREGFSLSKRRKVATKNISFCVRKGRVCLWFDVMILKRASRC